MKQVVQNLKRGTLTLEEVPVPLCRSGGVLVRTLYSAVSVGTERMKLKNAEMNYIQMVKAKPEQAKQVFKSFAQLGPVATYRKVMNRLDSFTPLGYSSSGEVIEVGEGVTDLTAGDRVACAGAYANHAEFVFMPRNLCSRIEDGVNPKDASLTTIASIAMQGFRQTNAQLGENVAIIGLGLLGQILVQIVQASGCRVFGFDIDPQKCNLAREKGAVFTAVADRTDFEKEVRSLTNGYGCDAVILTTSTKSNDPVILAGRIARDRAKIVDIGITRMDLPWELYYHKELDFRFSRSYGPGRYDPAYEEDGVDYPVGYVRWTEQRNMESVLQLLKDRKIDLNSLIIHTFPFQKAVEAYELIKNGKEDVLGVVYEYGHESNAGTKTVLVRQKRAMKGRISIGGIGAGNYASTMLYPFIKGNKDIECVGLATATGINAKDKAVKLGFEYATTDYRVIMNDERINTVLIATRHDQHAEMIIEGLGSNKHVYVEKPLALSVEELAYIVKAYEKSEKILMVGYNRRYAPSIRYLKRLLQPGIPYSIYYQVNAGFVPKESWYQAPGQGGRLIGEVGHFVDTIQYLLDSRPVSVFAGASTTPDLPEQDNCFIHVGFDNGSTGVIAYLSEGDATYPKEKISINGFQTNIEFENFKNILVYRGGRIKKKKFFSFDKGQGNEMNVLIESIVRGKDPVPIESLALTSLTTFHAVESLRTRNPIPISLDVLDPY